MKLRYAVPLNLLFSPFILAGILWAWVQESFIAGYEVGKKLVE